MSGVSAVLTAAGESRRMGTVKALLPWQGATLLEYQLETLSLAGASEIIVVLGHMAPQIAPLVRGRPQVKAVTNPLYRQGKATSIKAGLRAVSPSADVILIIGADQPRSAATLQYLLERHRQQAVPITIPTHRGKGGHPTIFSASLLPELLSITEEGMGLKGVVHRYSQQAAQVEMPDAEVLLDINTQPDYERALRFFSERGDKPGNAPTDN